MKFSSSTFRRPWAPWLNRPTISETIAISTANGSNSGRAIESLLNLGLREVQRRARVALFIGAALLVGCDQPVAKKTAPAEPRAVPASMPVAGDGKTILPGMQANPLESTNILRTFQARGVVRELPSDGQSVVVRHEEIPGFMAKMTMSFNIKDTNELNGLRVGDTITFLVRATEEDSWIENVRHAGTNDLAPLPPTDPSSASILHIAKLKRGDPMPDAELLSEDGGMVKLSDYRGRALAFTFIFTRCPLPDYCPRMNQHFTRARELLLQQPDGRTNWQFLSISFDPEFDKPGVLNRYAYSYRGASTDRWLFASAPTNVMKTFAAQLDFRFANEGGSFLHNLRTVVLDSQHRVFRQFDGNKWKAQELADALAEAASVDAK